MPPKTASPITAAATIEYVDILDCAGGKTGERIARDEAHRTGVWHGAFHCLIIYQRAGRGYALFQRRSSKKTIAPGMFDVSVGGHYAAGEGPETAGPRELAEELGLSVSYESLVPVGRRIFVYCFTPGIREQEFQDVFLLPRDIGLDALSLQEEEVDGVLEMDLEQGIELFSGVRSAATGRLRGTGCDSGIATVVAADFVPCLDAYYLKFLVLARRYFNGERTALAI